MHGVRFTAEKLAARLKLVEGAIYRDRLPLPPFRFHAGAAPLVGVNIDDRDWPALVPGTPWGTLRQDFTLRTSFAVPSGWVGPVALHLPLGRSASLEALAFLYGPEALAYVDGAVLQGVDVNHAELLLPDHLRDGHTHSLALAGWTGIRDERYGMGEPALVRIDPATRAFVGKTRIGLGVVAALPEPSLVRCRLLDTFDAAFRRLDLRHPFDEAFYASVGDALAVLEAGLAEAGPPAAEGIAAIGHAHLDVAWLWPLAQTRRKAARTFSNVLRLMDDDPDFRFSQSQPQLYAYVAEDHPELMETVGRRVAEGRWEPLGGMWIEADCNLTGAESLVRQFMLGERYFREQFGRPGAPILWLPDVFGYAWQLPQLIRQAGLKYFVTAKMSWNQYNRLPYDTFDWVGLDGSSVPTYLITTSKPGWWGATYSADLTPAEIFATWQGARQPELHDEMLVAFGHGDGGGGPTARMLEDARTLDAFPSAPRVRMTTAEDFLDRLVAKAAGRLPEWNGELYLELHRGTYTSQAANKRANRKLEFLLHDAEFLAAWAALATGFAYPHADFARAWQLLCLNQFHDIIPGSSIAEVYRLSARDHDEVSRLAGAARDTALAALDVLLPDDAAWVVYNPTSFARTELVAHPQDPMRLVRVADVPAYGYVALSADADGDAGIADPVSCGPVSAAAASAGTAPDAAFVLENGLLRVEFATDGDIVRIFDKAVGREVLPAGARANRWQLFEDRPLDWDAWDIDIFYDEKEYPVGPAESVEIVEASGLRGSLVIRRRFGASTLAQRITLASDGRRIDFATQVDWQERHVLLKVAFPVAVLSPRATYDIQWGNVERPTHRNTSWDWARFESCAHKWVDLSEADYGVSLLNDCKYGHDIGGNVIRLTVLRGATFPDPDADLGMHEFTYSLLPHLGDWRTETVREAYALNDPLIVRSVVRGGGGAAATRCDALLTADNPNVAIETVKQAEDGNGLIVRLYEFARSRGPVGIAAGFPLAAATATDLHEQPIAGLPVADGAVRLDITPYQIATLRLSPASPVSRG